MVLSIIRKKLFMDKWYKNIYRRNLIDMHINDDSEEYLSKFSSKEYFAYLKKANIRSPMIYLQSHTGLCNFPTKVSRTHKWFLSHPHEINNLIDLCHKDDMKVVGYYSLIFNNQAVIDHPSWEMRNKEGLSWREEGQRYGLCCPNNEEYRSFVVEQIKEIAKEFPNLDGIFFDMPYWEVICHCESCQKKWRMVSNKEMPTEINWNDPNWRLLIKKRQDWMGEFVKFVREEANKYMPNTTVEFNFAAVIGCNYLAGSTEIINEESEFTGGDLYGDLYNHSFTAKYYYSITKNQPFEYMTCRCDSSLREHTINKTKEQLESEIMLTTMHHGASLIIDAINPDGSLDDRVATNIGEVFKKEIPFEKYMDKGELYGEVALYFDSNTQFNNNNYPSNKEVAINVSKLLIENHISYNIIANRALNNLNKYKLIIAPSLKEFDNDEILKFIDYVKNGGVLYLSGQGDPRLIKEFFNGKIMGFINGNSPYKHVDKGYKEVQCYIAPTDKLDKSVFGDFNFKYPLPITYKLPILRFNNGDVLGKVVLPYTDPDNNNEFASIHSNPPGKETDYPAIIQTNYGRGKVIYSLAVIENDSRIGFKNIFMNLIKPYYENIFDISGSKYVESIIFKDDNKYYLNLFDLNFANDLVTRKIHINLRNDDYKIKEVMSDKLIETKKGEVDIIFEKYISLKIYKE